MDSIYQQKCIQLEEELQRLKFSTSLEIGNLQDEANFLRVSPALALLSLLITRQGRELHDYSSQ